MFAAWDYTSSHEYDAPRSDGDGGGIGDGDKDRYEGSRNDRDGAAPPPSANPPTEWDLLCRMMARLREGPEELCDHLFDR